MKILSILVVSIGFAILGLLAGVFWASKTGAAEGQGLAGGAIVLGYGVIGAVIFGLAGLLIATRLSEVLLKRTAVLMGAASVLFVAYGATRVRESNLAKLDPPEAYEGIPNFTVTIERTPAGDPVLAKFAKVDSKERQWSSQLPDERICRGPAPADALREAAKAVTAFVENEANVTCEGQAEHVLNWTLESDSGALEGSVGYNDACLNKNSALQYAVFAVRKVSQSTKSIKCK